ncbi:hypothetical protein GCM10018789_29700 [Streptomyces werraensis]|nr:hypothetical protein GCM10018789_29700 [Streptomyces werraensis]
MRWAGEAAYGTPARGSVYGASVYGGGGRRGSRGGGKGSAGIPCSSRGSGLCGEGPPGGGGGVEPARCSRVERSATVWDNSRAGERSRPWYLP